VRVGRILAMPGVLSLAEAGAQEKVPVAAAANISAVAPQLGAAFARRHPAYRAEFTFGASGALVTQIMNGVPFQVFMSADVAFPGRSPTRARPRARSGGARSAS
jgi:molybdate transport system substrate-binding protein